MEIQDAYSKDELLELAISRGYKITPRLFNDWVSYGLLAKAETHGRGRGRGVARTWSGSQANLLLALLEHHSVAKRPGTLANIPVGIWLYWGDDYVQLPQVRSAMNTWRGRYGKTSMSRGRNSARQMADQLTPDADPRIRNRFINEIANVAAYPESFNPDELAEKLGALLPETIEVRGYQVGPTGIVQLIIRRINGVLHLNDFSDRDYQLARATHLELLAHHVGMRPQEELAGQEFLQERFNSACLDLITHLGNIKEDTTQQKE